MRILQITPQVPFPPSDGGKVAMFNLTKYLAQMGHEITMLAFDRQEATEFGGLEEYCDLLRVPHSSKNTLRGVFWNLFSSLPYNISKYHSEPFENALKKL